MFRGYRCIILAALFGLTALAHAQPSSERSGENSAAAKSDQSTKQNVNVSASLSRIAGALEAEQRDSASGKAEDDERDRRDLEAQEDMADWAQAMFWAAAAQALLSLVGIVLIYITFREARRAADSGDTMAQEASKATAAAVEASAAGREANEIAIAARNEAAKTAEEQANLAARSTAAAISAAEASAKLAAISQSTAERQLRAYIIVDALDFNIGFDDEGIITEMYIDVRITNTGQTPGLLRHGVSIFSYFPVPEIPGKRDNVFDGRPSENITLGPNAPYKMRSPERLTPNHLNNVFEGKFRLFVSVWLKYYDIFHQERETHQAYEVKVLEDPSLPRPFGQNGEMPSTDRLFYPRPLPDIGYFT